MHKNKQKRILFTLQLLHTILIMVYPPHIESNQNKQVNSRGNIHTDMLCKGVCAYFMKNQQIAMIQV